MPLEPAQILDACRSGWSRMTDQMLEQEANLWAGEPRGAALAMLIAERNARVGASTQGLSTPILEQEQNE